MTPLRIRATFLLTVLALLATSCERMSVGPEIAGELRRGRAYATWLVEQGRSASAQDIAAPTAIALGYLERHRLGLGSPFRLIAYVLHDSRLADSTRTKLAWALLARTIDGDGAQIAPAALDSLEMPPPLGGVADGRAHRRLIERAVRDAHDPRAGELAVRLAYTLAAAERRVREDAPLVAAEAAALARDRELAEADARDLLREAWRTGGDPLAMLEVWRATHRFRVERPAMERLPAEVELEAMERAPELAEDIRTLGADADHAANDGSEDEGGSPSVLNAAAVALARIARATNAPPETPVVVSMSTYRGRLVGEPGLSRGERWARSRFVSRSRGEEALAAERALVAARAPGTTVERAVLSAAVALRAYAQETPWLPGDGGPTARQLADRFGLAAVTFDPGTPPAWKPYYRAMLASALGDLERVVPSLDLGGLRVHFGDSPMQKAALALHDPQRRVLYLPLGTGAGTIAHEVAHDLDWQAALTRYAVRGDYATDRSVRDARGGRLAASMRGLTAASLTSTADGRARRTLSARPTEVFARSMDWFVAVSLAREGRSNGYLSSVQDDLLTGYVTVTPPDITGEAGSALVSILDDVAPPLPAVRDWFLTRYGPGRALTPYDLVRRVLEAPLDSTREESPTLVQLVEPVVRARDAALQLLGATSCRGADGEKRERMLEARRRLVELAANARATGIMRDRGTVLATEQAWRWDALAPYAAAQPFVLGGAIGPALEGAFADRARMLDRLAPFAVRSIFGDTGCTATGDDAGA